MENANESERPLVTKLVDVLDRLNQGVRDEEDKIVKKKEQDKANRRSAAFALPNGEARVSTKVLPQGPSSLAQLDSLLDDLESFHAQNSGDPAQFVAANRDLVRPTNMQPPSYRPPELTDDDGSRRTSKLTVNFPAAPRDSSPQPPSPTASIGGKSALDSLDALLFDLTGAVADLPEPTSAPVSARQSTNFSALPPPIAVFTPTPVAAPAPVPVIVEEPPRPVVVVEERKSVFRATEERKSTVIPPPVVTPTPVPEQPSLFQKQSPVYQKKEKS